MIIITNTFAYTQVVTKFMTWWPEDGIFCLSA